MRILNAVLAAAAVTFAVASVAPDASARGFHGGGFHGHHWGGHFHRWGFRSHFGHRYSFYRHWHYGHRWHYRWHYRYAHFGYRSYRVAYDTAACPPGYHLGYLGRYCHPNRY